MNFDDARGTWLKQNWSKWQPNIVLRNVRLTEDADPVIPRISQLMELSEKNKDACEFEYVDGVWKIWRQ